MGSILQDKPLVSKSINSNINTKDRLVNKSKSNSSSFLESQNLTSVVNTINSNSESIFVNITNHFDTDDFSNNRFEKTIDVRLSGSIDTLNDIAVTDRAYREGLVLKFRNKARKLARSILRKWHARLDLQEVDSLVDLSLCEAVKRYDAAKGASFMTFLFFHLRGNLIRAVSGAANAHVIPGITDVEEKDTMVKEADSKDDIDNRSGNKLSATATEVAEALCSHEVCAPDELLLKKELASISAVACDKLDPLEKEVIQRIYLQEQQLLDIADSLGYSRCHISRVKKKALATLYDELKVTVADIYTSSRPNFDEDESTGKKKSVRRRRPRSQKSVEALINLSAA